MEKSIEVTRPDFRLSRRLQAKIDREQD